MTKQKYACLITFGCQMNDYDTSRLGKLLTERGWLLTDLREEADFIFFNTCSIREKAVTRLSNNLKQVKHLKQKRKVIIAVGGCVAEQEGQALLDRLPWLDMVIGPQHLPSIPEMLDNFFAPKPTTPSPPIGPALRTGSGQNPAWSQENLSGLGLWPSNNFDKQAYDPGSEGSPLLGSLTIMQGCNNYCAYCVVPYVRGPELSRNPEDILAEISGLIESGIKDLTLLGQNVNSYGHKLDGAPAFTDLLEQVDALGIPRLRFTTSHPKDFPPKLIKLFGKLPSLCESLHLPVQSGSDRILSAMGRIYTTESYLELVDGLRASCPKLALSTDIIVGFPGETEADFLQTMELIEKVGYDSMFSFKYSDRPQTTSNDLLPKVPEEEKGRRLTHLQTVQKEITLQKNAVHVGETMEILVERVSSRYAGQLTGRARNFKLVHFDGGKELIGKMVQVHITEAWAASLRGELEAPR